MQWLRYMKESCNTHEEAISSHERVMTHTHAHRTTQANADICTSRGTLINGVCVWLAHTDLQPREQLLTWISHATHTNESCRTCKCDNASKCGCMDESCHTYKRVVTHTHTHTPTNTHAITWERASSRRHMNKSLHTYRQDLRRIWMRRGSHHSYDWIVPHTHRPDGASECWCSTKARPQQ